MFLETLAGFVHLEAQRGIAEMSVVRMILQPAGLRPTVLAEKNSAFVVKLQQSLARTGAMLTQTAELLVALINPLALIALVLGLWRLTSDIGWTGAFLVSEGLFSHWQVWIALAIGLKSATTFLAPKTRVAAKISEETKAAV